MSGAVLSLRDSQDGHLQIGAFTLTKTGLTVHGTPPFPEWERFGSILTRIEGCSRFALGDWWAHGENAHSEEAAQAVDEGSAKTYLNYAWVSRRIPFSRRRESLDWSHHEAVAALEPADQDEILGRAEQEQLSVRRVRELVRLRRPAKDGAPPAVRVIVRLDPETAERAREKAARVGMALEDMGAELIKAWVNVQGGGD